MRPRTWLAAAALLALAVPAPAADLPLVKNVERQPLTKQVERLVEALDLVGAPLSEGDRNALKDAFAEKDAAKAVERIQGVLDPHCLAGVRLSAAGGKPPASWK